MMGILEKDEACLFQDALTMELFFPSGGPTKSLNLWYLSQPDTRIQV